MGEGSSSRLEAPTKVTQHRWNSQYLPLVLSSVCFLGVLLLELAGSQGLLIPLTLLGTAFVMVAAFLGFVAYWKDPAHVPSTALWAGNGTLRITNSKSWAWITNSRSVARPVFEFGPILVRSADASKFARAGWRGL